MPGGRGTETGASGRSPKGPRERDWGERMEDKVRTHLLAWLALYSLGQSHATGWRKRRGEKKEGIRERHTQESVLKA